MQRKSGRGGTAAPVGVEMGSDARPRKKSEPSTPAPMM